MPPTSNASQATCSRSDAGWRITLQAGAGGNLKKGRILKRLMFFCFKINLFFKFFKKLFIK
jgi:hypothetical protein